MRLTLFLGLLGLINTCQEEKEEPKIVTCWFPCITSYIARFESEPPTTPRASITAIHTKSSGAYYLISGYNDVPSVLLDYNCEIVCYPDKSSAVARSGNCPELADETLQVTWEDKR